jgi:hypothetical protein
MEPRSSTRVLDRPDAADTDGMAQLAPERTRPAARRGVRLAAQLALPAAHLCLCLAVELGVYGAEGSWAWFLVFLVDFPFSILLLPAANRAGYLLVFGVAGTLWWYMLSRIGVYIVCRIDRANRAGRATASRPD